MPPSLVTIDASEPLEKILDIIARDGGVIVSNFLDTSLLKELMTSIEPYFAGRKLYDSESSHDELGEDFFPQGSQRIYALLGKIPDTLTKILRLSVWQGIMEKYLVDEVTAYTGDKLLTQKSGYMMASTAAIRLVPGAKAQPLHRDQLAYAIQPDPTRPFFSPMLGCLIAGSRCTKKNGATAVIPGSHLWPSDRAPKVEECTYAEMQPGSALFTLGNLYHGSGDNVCDPSDPEAQRTIFAVFGQRDYFRQDQEEILSTPIEIARRLPEDILKIAGYYKAVGGVGYVEDHQSAAEFLQAKTGLGAFGARSNKGLYSM